jgi:large subunit ribosomal protein L9
LTPTERGLTGLLEAPTIRRQTGVIIIAKVLLTKTVENVGHVGEVIDVADGYARNYLFPRGLGVAPTEHNRARYAKEKVAHEAELLEREEKAGRLRNRLADQVLVFVRKAHDDDRLYGSVRAEDVTAQIEDLLDERIEPSRVLLERPIETLGPHSVTVNLYKDISVEVRIRIDEEEPKEE